MATYKIRCRLSYHDIRLDELDVFAAAVLLGIFGNIGVFATPPISEAAFQALIDDYVSKRGGYKARIISKAIFNVAKNALMAALDLLSDYVNGIADNNADTIILSNFIPTKGTASEQNPPATPTGITLKRVQTGELVSDCEPTPGAVYFGSFLSAKNITGELVITPNGQILMIEDEPLVQSLAPQAGAAATSGELVFIFDITKNRRKRYTNLQPGTTYYVYYYAGNAVGVSMISDPVSFLLW